VSRTTSRTRVAATRLVGFFGCIHRRAAQAHDAALMTASAEKWLNGWSAAATFEGELSNVTTSYADERMCGTHGEDLTSVYGTTRKSRDVRFRAAIRGIADVKRRPPIL
jgi:hypothetical protein